MTTPTVITFTEGVAGSVSVADLLLANADRVHGGWEIQSGGYTENSSLNWLPGVNFNATTKSITYDGSPLSKNSVALTPNPGYYVGSEVGPYNPLWPWPPATSFPPPMLYDPVAKKWNSQSMQGGSKHTNFVYRPVDGKMYNMGGDYATYESVWNPDIYHAQDGAPVFWRYDPRLPDATAWDRYYPSLGRVGEQVPLDPDRMNWEYDAGRDVFWMTFGSVRVGSFFGNSVPAGTATAQVNRYFKGCGGIANAVPEGSDTEQLPMLLYDPKIGSMKYVCPNPVLITPWGQSANSFMQSTGYHQASKRLYSLGTVNNMLVVYWLDTTAYDTDPTKLAWQSVSIDVSKVTPPMGNPYNIGRTTKNWVDDASNVIYMFHSGTNQAIYALTLPGHPLGAHKIIQVADLTAAIGWNMNTAPSGTGLGAESPFVWIPEHRVLVLMTEPSEEMVGPYTRSVEINVDTGAVTDGPRFPNSDKDGLPWFPNAGFWYPPTQELIIYGISIMEKFISGGNRSWDGPGSPAPVPAAMCRYKRG